MIYLYSTEKIQITGACPSHVTAIEISFDGARSWRAALEVDPSAQILCSSKGSYSFSIDQANSNLVQLISQSSFSLYTRAQSNFGKIADQEIAVKRVQQTAPVAPTGINLISPMTSPSNQSYPLFRVSTTVAGDTIGLYSDSNCTLSLGSALASGPTADVAVTGVGYVISGTYQVYAQAQNSIGASPCSAVSATYIFDNIAPSFWTPLS